MKTVLSALLLMLAACLSHAQKVEQVASVSLTVSSLDVLVPFYEEVLTFEKVGEYELSGNDLQQLIGISDTDLKAKIAILQLGDERIELIEFVNEDQQRPIPSDSRSNDLWFQHIAIVVQDMNAAYQRLRQHKVQHVSTAPQTLPDYLPAAAGISAFYFRDPDGHNLELIQFPAAKGNPKWQQPSEKLFLGIDHTAIGIDDTDTSTLFYDQLLGLKVAGNSENYGSEQEHLNQVFGAHLFITGLKASQGFGIEFLDYIAPPGGRTYPADSQPTDLWHWHTTIQVDDVEAMYQKLQQQQYHFISKGIARLNGHAAFLVQDPDGHAVLVKG